MRRSDCGWTGGISQRMPGLSLCTVIAMMLILFLAGCQSSPVPSDAQDSCPLDSATFNGWFQSGTASLNGVVNPANSLNNLAPDCGFYQWSQQMFMWLTSPAPSTYGGGAHIFDSPAFYDVSPPDGSGNRTLLAHTPNFIHAFPLRAAKLGAHRLPIVIDRSGRLIEAKPVDPNLKPMVRDVSGKVIEIAHARLENGRTILLDQEGKVIQTQHVASPMANADQNNASPVVQRFLVDNIALFIDPSLAVVDVEQGQAGDGSVLEAQTTANGSLVYYATMVNDVYAYFLTGVKKGAITTVTPNQFPTTPTDLSNIVNFAMANGKPNPPFPDPNALAIEVKSSWVLAAGLPNASSYITMTATVPTYNQGNPNLWTPTGQQTVQLALVGIHVVGSTAGHPEMVWATFEHTNNTPLGTYSYTKNDGTTNTVTQNTSGTWLFTGSGSNGPFNVAHMAFTGPNGAPANSIQSEPTFTISPSDTLRMFAFGSSDQFENTEVISIDNHVLQMMPQGDIRGNYFMTGATWTPFGSNPGGGNNGVGTNQLSNSTLETYAQGSNCFSCHQNINPNLPNVTTDVSHIFAGIQPLF
jgi:hypothetical protein